MVQGKAFLSVDKWDYAGKEQYKCSYPQILLYHRSLYRILTVLKVLYFPIDN